MSVITDSKVWGPHVWYFMHQVAFRLPQNYTDLPLKTKQQLNKFYVALKLLLPCPSCQTHYGSTLERAPPSKYSTSGLKMAKWTVDAHNFANIGLKKKVVPFESARKMYKVPGGVHYKLNHGKLQLFIYYMLVNSVDKPLANRKTIATCISQLYPCQKCRIRFQNYFKNNNPNKAKNNIQMRKWAKKFYAFVKIRCV